MDKAPDAFRTISEVAEVLETPAHVLRFWESRFPQIKPVKRAGGRRYYRPADVALLAGIRQLLHSEGMTIRGVQKVLREQGVRHVAALGGADISDMDLEGAEGDAVAPDVAADLPPDLGEVVALDAFARRSAGEAPLSGASVQPLFPAEAAGSAGVGTQGAGVWFGAAPGARGVTGAYETGPEETGPEETGAGEDAGLDGALTAGAAGTGAEATTDDRPAGGGLAAADAADDYATGADLTPETVGAASAPVQRDPALLKPPPPARPAPGMLFADANVPREGGGGFIAFSSPPTSRPRLRVAADETSQPRLPLEPAEVPEAPHVWVEEEQPSAGPGLTTLQGQTRSADQDAERAIQTLLAAGRGAEQSGGAPLIGAARDGSASDEAAPDDGAPGDLAQSYAGSAASGDPQSDPGDADPGDAAGLGADAPAPPVPDLSGLAARLRGLRAVSQGALPEMAELHSRLGLLHAQMAEALRLRR